MLRESSRHAMGQYNVLIVNCRVSQCRLRLLGEQHPAPCLPARPSELSRSSLYQPRVACFIQLSIPSQSTHYVSTGHAADGMLTACQSRVGVGGRSTYMRVLNFERFFSLKVNVSTYMRIALYAGIYGKGYLLTDVVVSGDRCEADWQAEWMDIC